MTIELYECTPNCDFEKAIRKGRGRMHCAKCGRDLGIEYYLWAQEEHPEWFERKPKTTVTVERVQS